MKLTLRDAGPVVRPRPDRPARTRTGRCRCSARAQRHQLNGRVHRREPHRDLPRLPDRAQHELVRVGV